MEFVRSISWPVKLLVLASDTDTKMSITPNTSMRQSFTMAETESGVLVVPCAAILWGKKPTGEQSEGRTMRGEGTLQVTEILCVTSCN